MITTTQLARREHVITEARHLLDGGIWPPVIAERLGYKDVPSMRESLRRWQEWELADRLHRERWDSLYTVPRNQHMRRR